MDNLGSFSKMTQKHHGGVYVKLLNLGSSKKNLTLCQYLIQGHGCGQFKSKFFQGHWNIRSHVNTFFRVISKKINYVNTFFRVIGKSTATAILFQGHSKINYPRQYFFQGHWNIHSHFNTFFRVISKKLSTSIPNLGSSPKIQTPCYFPCQYLIQGHLKILL